ncbi:radical SAM protein [Thermodesulfobacteriota bacterium]
MKTALVLVPPNIPSMGSAAGGRYQATYNTEGDNASHYFPLWVCYAAGAVPTARAMDCNAESISRESFLESVEDYDIYVFYANQETIDYDTETARLLHLDRPNCLVAFAGPYSTVAPEKVVASPGIDMVIRGELENPLRELCAGKPFGEIKGLTFKNGAGVVSNPAGEPFEDLDSLPWVSQIIQRDLSIHKYFIPFLNHPYISIFSGRGCPYGCTYCLWPQTIAGRRYRKRSISDVAEEMLWIKREMPEIKEIQIEDDTFTCDRGRVLELCDALKGKDVSWSCCARYDLEESVLSRMAEAGARNLVVGFESGNDQILRNIKKGLSTEAAHGFRKACRKVGLKIHGCFILGLPGETHETMEQTFKYACQLAPDTVQFAIATPYEGTAFNDYLREEGYLKRPRGITDSGHLSSRFDYPGLTGQEIDEFAKKAWTKYYLRPSIIARHLIGAFSSFEDAKRFLSGAKYIGDYIFKNGPGKNGDKKASAEQVLKESRQS